jgi:hypothetical protein
VTTKDKSGQSRRKSVFGMAVVNNVAINMIKYG